MKKAFYRSLAGLCALAGVLSCNGGFSTRDYGSTESFPLSEGSGAALKIEIGAEYPSGGLKAEAAENIREAITSGLFGEKYSSLGIEEAIEAYKNDKVEEYRELNLPLAESGNGSAPASAGWSDHVSGKVTGVHDGIMSYTVTRYAFTGGAHGMTEEKAMNFHMKTGNLLTEEDFFKEGYKDALPEILSSRLASSIANPADTSMLFTREIGPNGNFSISEDGVTYIYNQYEIGPYAMGIIRVTVPWDELEGLYWQIR